MTTEKPKTNRAVWFDIPVADLDRANTFYGGVLACTVDTMEHEGIKFSILEHNEGIGGCLVPKPYEVAASCGILLYMNVDGRIHDAMEHVGKLGGKVIEEVTSIGPYGFRAVILDSEGNRIALHSETDA